MIFYNFLIKKEVSIQFLRMIGLLILFYFISTNILNAQISNGVYCNWGDLSEVPDPADDIKYIKLNFHVLRNSNGEGNFQDDFIDVRAIKLMVDKANYFLSENDDKVFWINSDGGNVGPSCANPNNTGNGVCIDPLPYSKIRFVIFPMVGDPDDPNQDGIYFWDDDDDDLCFIQGSCYPGVNYESSCPHNLGSNLVDSYSYDKFKKHEHKVLNVFILNDHPDYLECVEELNSNVVNPQSIHDLSYPTNKGWGPGYSGSTYDTPFATITSYYTHFKNLVGLGNYENLAWDPTGYHIECRLTDSYGLLLTHEIGHCLGLRHTYSGIFNPDFPGGAPSISMTNNNNYMSYNPNTKDVFVPSQLSYVHCGLENINSRIHPYVLQQNEVVHVCGEVPNLDDISLSGFILAEDIEAERIESTAATFLPTGGIPIKYEVARAIKLNPGFNSANFSGESSLSMEVKPDLYFECNEYTIADFGDYSNLTETASTPNGGFHVGEGFSCWQDLSEFRITEENEKFNLEFTCAHHSHEKNDHNHEHLNLDKEVQIFPNPSSGIFNIKVSRETTVEEYSLYNSNGEQIGLFSGKGFSGKIDLSDYPVGIYFLHIKTGEQVFIERMVLSK